MTKLVICTGICSRRRFWAAAVLAIQLVAIRREAGECGQPFEAACGAAGKFWKFRAESPDLSPAFFGESQLER